MRVSVETTTRARAESGARRSEKERGKKGRTTARRFSGDYRSLNLQAHLVVDRRGPVERGRIDGLAGFASSTKAKRACLFSYSFFFFASFRPSSHTHTHSRSAGEPKIERKNRRNRDPGEIPLHYRRWLFVESSPAIGGPFPKRARLPHPRSRLLQPSRKAGGDLRLCLPVSLPLPVLSPLCCGEMRFRKAEERGGVCVCSVFVLKSASAAGALWPFYPAAILRSAARDLSHV